MSVFSESASNSRPYVHVHSIPSNSTQPNATGEFEQIKNHHRQRVACLCMPHNTTSHCGFKGCVCVCMIVCICMVDQTIAMEYTQPHTTQHIHTRCSDIGRRHMFSRHYIAGMRRWVFVCTLWCNLYHSQTIPCEYVSIWRDFSLFFFVELHIYCIAYRANISAPGTKMPRREWSIQFSCVTAAIEDKFASINMQTTATHTWSRHRNGCLSSELVTNWVRWFVVFIRLTTAILTQRSIIKRRHKKSSFTQKWHICAIWRTMYNT